MATNWKLRTVVQNSYSGSPTKEAIRHLIPEYVANSTDYDSVVVEITGTGATNGVSNDATLPIYTVDSSAVKHPITGLASFVLSKWIGFAFYVGRAAAGTAPTGTATLTLTDFCGLATNGALNITEGCHMTWHNPNAGTVTDGENINFSLSGTTGYKISLIVWFETA